MNCRGLEGHLFRMGASVEPDSEGNWLEERINGSNLPESQRIWRLVSKGYVPIDWHLDFKSGYRWSESTWYLNIRYGHKPGVDVKVPWELARMQHLPQLAWAYGLAKEKHPDFLPPYTYSDEFRNQFLDFVATNPPRFGANWHMTMDVAIRAVNWLVAYDLFRVYGADFDEEFNRIFLPSRISGRRWSGQRYQYAPRFNLCIFRRCVRRQQLPGRDFPHLSNSGQLGQCGSM